MSVDWILLQQYYQGDRASMEELIGRHLHGLVVLIPRFDREPEKVLTFLKRYLCQFSLAKRKERVKANSQNEVKKSLEVAAKNAQDRFWINDFCRGRNEGVFLLFDRYAKRLVLTSLKIVNRKEVACDIVANLQLYFLNMPLAKRKEIFGQGRVICIQPYLMKTVRNRSLDWGRKNGLVVLPGKEVLLDQILDEKKPILTDYEENQLRLIYKAVALLPEKQQKFFEYWKKGIPNETIENELALVQKPHHIKEAIKRHIANYARAEEDIYQLLLRSHKFNSKPDPSKALLEAAKLLLKASDFHDFLQFRDEHLAGKTTQVLNIEHMKNVVTIKRRIKKLLINGN